MVSFFTLDQAQGQSQQDPNQSDPLGPGSQLLVPATQIVLAHVGLGITCQSTGQAGFLAGLNQNSSNQSHASQALQNDHNHLQNIHFRLPPSDLASAANHQLITHRVYVTTAHI